jgi:cytoskeletal protein CcmA (bactofilin family)
MALTPKNETIEKHQSQEGAPLPIDATDAAHARSMLADGLHFVGNALLRGPFSVSGQVDGNITQAEGIQVSVVVTESGRVKGDITAHKISVMGHTDGVLDTGPGEVSLHDSASVHGLVRYGRIQVNGADLNATLERVAQARKVN